MVYYFRANVRCPACRTLEACSREVVAERFSAGVADGRISGGRSTTRNRATNISRPIINCSPAASCSWQFRDGHPQRWKALTGDLEHDRRSRPRSPGTLKRRSLRSRRKGHESSRNRLSQWRLAWACGPPCNRVPMTANLAAVSYLGRRAGSSGSALFAALLYAAGQMIAYVGLALLVLEGVASAWRLSVWCKQHVNQVLGPVWILTAMVLLGPDSLSPAGSERRGRSGRRRSMPGEHGARCRWGFVLALGFCPVSATIFFVDLLTIAAGGGSHVLYPAVYALGAALPVFLIALLAGYRLAVAGFGPESHAAGAALAEPDSRRSAAGGGDLLCAEVQLRGLFILMIWVEITIPIHDHVHHFRLAGQSDSCRATKSDSAFAKCTPASRR